MEKIHKPRECDCYLDYLTGVSNRRALLEYIKSDKEYTVFILDIDNFSNINNYYGYLVGDEILKSVTYYLSKLKPPKSELFRFDNDQFILLIEDPISDSEKEEVAQLVISFFNNIEVYKHENGRVKIFFSIGIYTGNGYNLINYANLALQDARQFKKNSYKLFDSNSSYIKNQLQNIEWISHLRKYIEEEKFVLFYQPILDNRTKKVTKYECLIRIAQNSSYIAPHDFMYACKATGTLELITRFVIKTACEKFENTDYSFSINITAEDINLGFLEHTLLEKSKQHNIDPSRITLEILEDISTLTKPYEIEQINSLKEKGFHIAVDDFGVENSNFSRLIDFMPEYIKIDGLFIKDLVDNKKSQTVVRTIVDFCKHCKIDVIAEYVCNKEILAKVQEYGIEFSQGYAIGEPQKELLEEADTIFV